MYTIHKENLLDSTYNLNVRDILNMYLKESMFICKTYLIRTCLISDNNKTNVRSIQMEHYVLYLSVF